MTRIKKKSNAFILMLIIVTSMFIFARVQSISPSVTITATGNPDITFINPNVPPEWPFGDFCTEDVYNIVNAVLDDNVKTIYLQNGPNGEEFVFAGAAPFVWVTKPKIIEGLDARVPNDGSEVPLEYSAKVPATKIKHNTEGFMIPVFGIGSSGVTLRNLWLDSDNGGILRFTYGLGFTFILPPNPNPYGDITIEDNVFVTKKCGLSIWEIECGLNIINNYINVRGGLGEDLDESWTAIMVWSEDPAYGTKDDVNVVGNYIKYNKAWWAVEFGGQTYRSKRTNILDNTFTGSLVPNYEWTKGDASLSLKSEEGKYIVTGNRFVDLDSPDGCAILLRGVKKSLISNNEFKNLQVGEPESPWKGAIFCTLLPLPGIEDPYTKKCKIIANDYRDSGLPGWNEANPDGIGCLLLDEYTEDNLVLENLFPKGTSASTQILDMTDDPATEEYDGNNKIVGRFLGGQ